MFYKLILIFALFSLIKSERIICYFASWTVYRPGNGMYNASMVPPDLCTHVYYSFVGLNEDGTLNNMDSWETDGLHELAHLRRLRWKNPNLKLIVSMGGWNEGSEKYSRVSASPQLRQTMVGSVLDFLKKEKFDGFDLDWEYPAQRGGSPDDVENFVVLLNELNMALKAEPEKYLLSVAVSGGIASADTSYDYQKLHTVVDFINVMTYDYHGDWEPYTGHFAPLRASHLDKGDNAQLNVYEGFMHWINQEVPPEKLNLGIGTYGRSFSLTNMSQQGLYAPVNGPGNQGPYTEEAGTLGYNEICEFYPNFESSKIFDEEQEVPHMVFDGNQWIGYQDIDSVQRKARFAKSVGAGGGMFWSLDTDDFLGICGNGKYPLINAFKQAWNE